MWAIHDFYLSFAENEQNADSVMCAWGDALETLCVLGATLVRAKRRWATSLEQQDTVFWTQSCCKGRYTTVGLNNLRAHLAKIPQQYKNASFDAYLGRSQEVI